MSKIDTLKRKLKRLQLDLDDLADVEHALLKVEEEIKEEEKKNKKPKGEEKEEEEEAGNLVVKDIDDEE